MAQNLLRSYRHFSAEPMPFALLCDRENEYTVGFDDVILFKDGATNSYLDKLALANYLPYDETIFIDADCLAYGDLNGLFSWFREADDMSCFGRVLPLDDRTGWFEYENLGELQNQVSYVVGLHGGIYYMRRTAKTRQVFDCARQLVPEYSLFQFKGRFENPGDEPLIALSMALNDCHPVPFQLSAICCYWEYVGAMDIDITEGKAEITGRPVIRTRLVHWGTRYTRELEYRKQVELLTILESGTASQKQIDICKARYRRLITADRRMKFMKRVKNKIRRTLGVK